MEAEVLSALDHQAAWSWLAVLTEGERHSIALAFFGGHTYQEVATLLALPEGTVKSRIRSGLRRLHETLVDKRGAVGATI
ncbi:MAG: polymerase subunit sigma [Ilumatobacteraceae bacterium]|nr:polymerase subunit sigma [Ilumatobacteraceae bacterium]